MKQVAIVMTVFSLLFASCGVQKSTQNQTNSNKMETFDKIVYIFREASLPPQYYRNYTITLAKGTGNVRIYDYANDFLKKDFKVSGKKWAELQEIAGKLTGESVKITKGATGTKTYSIELYAADKKVYSYVWDSLSDAGEVNASLQKLITESVSPNLGGLVEKTMEK